MRIGCTYEVIHRLCPQVCETCWNRSRLRSVFDSVGTLHTRRRCLVLLAGLCIVGTTPATAAKEVTTSIDSLILYSHSRIVNYKEFQCFYTLIKAESNWRVEAINPNGNHFGLGQMRNTKYRNLDGYRMIDWSLRYIAHRYSGSSCKALEHWRKHGWH